MSPQFCLPGCRSRKTKTTRSFRLTFGVVGRILGLLLLHSLSSWAMSQTPTPVPVPTWRYDLTHAGQNSIETALTPTNVNHASFGKLFSVSVDGTIFAQPLYVPGLKM